MVDQRDVVADEDSDRPAVRAGLRPSQIVTWLVLGTLLAAGLGFLLLVHFNRDREPTLTMAEVDAAARLWQKNGPESYVVDLETTGPRNDRIRIEVRQGRVIACTINGLPPLQRRVWESWIVPRQFDYIREDLRRAGKPGESALIERAEFDPHYGLPRSYWCYHAMAGGREVQNGWRITQFRPLPDAGG